MNLLFTDNYKLGLHHGSLSKEHRQKTENLFINEKIDTIISTSSLELGIDFKNIDQVLNIGTPKSINRLIQRSEDQTIIFMEFPTSYLIPTNKFEFLECIYFQSISMIKNGNLILWSLKTAQKMFYVNTNFY